MATLIKPRKGTSIQGYPSVGPYTWITFDQKRTFEESGRTFRIIVYGAFNAYGLIGSEHNGVAVLDEDQMQVLCDDIAKDISGYFGPSDRQWGTAEWLTEKATWEEFQSLINSHPKRRYQL